VQRRATKRSTRAQNADEKRFMLWVKDQSCIECGNHGVIVDHMYGQTMIHNKVLIGHWALLPLCCDCDRVKTFGSHNAYREMFKRTQAQAWVELMQEYPEDIPVDVQFSIIGWGK